MKIIDISMELSDETVTYEGDQGIKFEIVKNFPQSRVMLSKVDMGLHSGTHVDSPAHFLDGGKKLDEMPLESLIGKARVCDLTDATESVGASELKGCKIEEGEIVLLKTKNSELLDDKKFHREFVHLTDDGADYLVDNKIKAVGIDYLSIDKFKSETGYVHKSLLSKDILIIEGLDLRSVQAGTYTLYCLPLRIKSREAAPARCILIDEG